MKLLLGAVCAASVVLSGCVAPPGNTSSYEAKAVRTAVDARSQVQTVRLTVQAYDAGRMLSPYLTTVLSSAEDSFSSIENTFGSIQPPDSTKADQIRDDLGQILSDGSDAMSQARIAGRRGDRDQLADAAKTLDGVADRLEHFSSEHSA